MNLSFNADGTTYRRGKFWIYVFVPEGERKIGHETVPTVENVNAPKQPRRPRCLWDLF
jgi:hypothetical protein